MKNNENINSTNDETIKEEVVKSDEMCHALFEHMLNGIAYCKMIYDTKDKSQDFIYIKVNPAFEKLTGLKDVVGKRVTQVIPNIKNDNPELFELYNRVSSSGKPEVFEDYVKELKMWFLISVYSTQKGYFVAVFDVINERKRTEETTKRKIGEMEKVNELMVDRELKMIELKKENEELKKQLSSKNL